MGPTRTSTGPRIIRRHPRILHRKECCSHRHRRGTHQRLLLCLPLEVMLRVLRALRVLHVPLLLPLLLPLELPLVCCVFYRVSFPNNLCL